MQNWMLLFKSFWKDGYSWYGSIAPFSSLVLTGCKLWGNPVSLVGVSYAWTLLPITVWVVIAYIRRWQASQGLLETLRPKVSLRVDQGTGHRVSIAAENHGSENAEDMAVVIHRVLTHHGQLVHELDEPLVRSETGADVVPLRPGHVKRFDVAKLENSLYPKAAAILSYVERHGENGLDKHRAIRALNHGMYILEIRAVSKTTTPTKERFRLSYTEDGKLLVLKKITT